MFLARGSCDGEANRPRQKKLYTKDHAEAGKDVLPREDPWDRSAEPHPVSCPFSVIIECLNFFGLPTRQIVKKKTIPRAKIFEISVERKKYYSTCSG